MAAAHYLIYYVENSGGYIITTPKHWAKSNQFHFPNHYHNDNIPTVTMIEGYLQENYGFQLGTENEETVVYYNFNINIPPANNLPFIE